MSSSLIKQLPKSTVELEIQIAWNEVKESYQRIFAKVASEFEYQGFRRGKVPKKIIEEKVDKTKIYQEIVKEIVPRVYQEALNQHKLSPIISPKIEVLKAKENEEWVIKATLALKPKVNLKQYKEKIKEFKKTNPKIWTPGQNKETEDKDKKPSLDEVIKILLDEVEIELSELLITEETNRLLANLIDQTKKLGLTVEQYILAKGKTTEQLRAEYSQEAAKNLKIEFCLSEIADKENITVSQDDIDQLISKAATDEDKERLKKDSYYLAHLLRQQKTLDLLYNL